MEDDSPKRIPFRCLSVIAHRKEHYSQLCAHLFTIALLKTVNKAFIFYSKLCLQFLNTVSVCGLRVLIIIVWTQMSNYSF